jgi:hypothetical protein
MASHPADGEPSDHQKKCIKRMLKGDPNGKGVLRTKRNIIRGLLAWQIRFRFRDALQYVRYNYKSLGNEEDLSASLRLYETLGNDDVSYLATLANVPLPTVARWIDEIGKSFADPLIQIDSD